MKSLKVKTLPKYLKENIEVDISHLELNGNVRVQDVKADNMEVMNSPRIPIASVVLTRQLKQEEAVVTPAAAAATPAATATPATKGAPAKEEKKK
jgi:large subunit ribosomal protein L25